MKITRRDFAKIEHLRYLINKSGYEKAYEEYKRKMYEKSLNSSYHRTDEDTRYVIEDYNKVYVYNINTRRRNERQEFTLDMKDSVKILVDFCNKNIDTEEYVIWKLQNTEWT